MPVRDSRDRRAWKYLHLTVYSLSLRSRVVKMWWIALGITPATSERLLPSALSLSPPSIVYVFPVPVWPYAKMVQLKPSSTSSTIGAIAWLYNLSCPESGPNTCSMNKLSEMWSTLSYWECLYALPKLGNWLCELCFWYLILMRRDHTK